jgi:hypothetical protein
VLRTIKNIITALLILMAGSSALAQTGTPATAAKALGAANTSAAARPVSNAEKSTGVAPPSDGLSAASETMAEAPEGLKLAPGRRDPFRPITLNVRTNRPAQTRRRRLER